MLTTLAAIVTFGAVAWLLWNSFRPVPATTVIGNLQDQHATISEQISAAVTKERAAVETTIALAQKRAQQLLDTGAAIGEHAEALAKIAS